MNKDMEKIINEIEVPIILKDYLLRSNNIYLNLTEELLLEIQKIYIEYDSLYEFDEAEFCSYVIISLKKQDKYKYFYYYLKKILDNSLNVTTKSNSGNGKSNLISEDQILVTLEELLETIKRYNVEKKVSLLFRSYKLTGELEILFKLYPNNSYEKKYEDILSKLLKISF